MLLAVDIGNTSTALGLFSGEELIAHFRIHTDRMRMESEYRVILKNLFALIPNCKILPCSTWNIFCEN